MQANTAEINLENLRGLPFFKVDKLRLFPFLSPVTAWDWEHVQICREFWSWNGYTPLQNPGQAD